MLAFLHCLPGRFSPNAELHASHHAGLRYGYDGYKFKVIITDLEHRKVVSEFSFSRDYSKEDRAYYGWVSDHHLYFDILEKYGVSSKIKIVDINEKDSSCEFPVDLQHHKIISLPKRNKLAYLNTKASQLTFYDFNCRVEKKIDLPNYDSLNRIIVNESNKYLAYYDVNETNLSKLSVINLEDDSYNHIDFVGSINDLIWSKDNEERFLIKLMNIDKKIIWIESWNEFKKITASPFIGYNSNILHSQIDFGYTKNSGELYYIERTDSNSRAVNVIKEQSISMGMK